MSVDRPRHPITQQRVLYEMAGTDAVTVRRDVAVPGDAGHPLAADFYYPADGAGGDRPPAVAIVAGFPDAGFERITGCRFKEMASSISWARLIAASGLVAVTYANVNPASDLDALLVHMRRDASALGIDGQRFGLWASSGNGPLALSLLMKDRGTRPSVAALAYPYTMDTDRTTAVADAAKRFGFANPCAGRPLTDLASDVPLLLARAGRDETPGLNEALDRFVPGALAANLPLTLVNHPEGPHAFDLFHDSAASRRSVRLMLSFLRETLR